MWALLASTSGALCKICALLILAALLWLLNGAGVAYAHDGQPVSPHDLWSAWNWEPLVLSGLLLSGWLYGRGVYALWRRAGYGRSVGWGQVVAFAVGLLALFVALVSPLDALSESLFAAHMVQHLLLMNVAAPLLVWGIQPALPLWTAPRSTRRTLAHWWRGQRILQLGWQRLCQPAAVWSIYVATLWSWHSPRLYQAALRNEMVHLVEHLAFLGSSLLFWAILRRDLQPSGFNDGMAILFLFTTALHSGLLAALITFAGQPLYPFYTATVAAWGLTPLSDQQLAGVVMWVPVGFLYLAAMLWRIASYLQHTTESRRPLMEK